MNEGKNICEDCGKVYTGGLWSHFCPSCRKMRQSKAAKKRQLNRLGYEARWGKADHKT